MCRGQDNGTTILLGLKEYSVGEVVEREERIVVKTEVKGRMKCPHCGSGKLYGHGMCQPREILHAWSNGRRVYLEFHRRRWKCRDCKRAFTEGRALVRSHSRLTRQAEAEALWQLKDRSFSQVKRGLTRLVDCGSLILNSVGKASIGMQCVSKSRSEKKGDFKRKEFPLN